jgi:Rad3-related DNA helicase
LNTYAFRFESFEQRVRALIDSENENVLRLLFWDGRESVWRLWVAPIEVASMSEPFFASKRAVVLTSATLSSGVSPDFVIKRIGLNTSRPLLSLPSPYALEKQAVVYIPSDIAPPGTASHLEALLEFTGQVAGALGGRTLLLMTSNRRLKFAAEALRDRMLKSGITVLDSLSDRRAADVFRVTDRALLIGSERYGEGLDIPGKALTCVIIEKINEAMTRSPLAEARKARTQFGLYDYDFPLRMMWLKQRAGRLIRSPSDTGAIVVFDARYHAWSQSSRAHVNRALAPMPIKGGTREQIVGLIEAGFGRD